MSTKIYVAYRTKPCIDGWTLLMDIKRQARMQARRALRELYPKLLNNSESAQEMATRYKTDKPGYSEVGSFVKHLYTEAARFPDRVDLFNLTTELGVWKQGGRFYLIPYADMLMSDVFNFLRDDPRLEEYGYWNNTDRPEHISRRDWDARRQVWDKIIGRWDDHVTIEAVSLSGFHHVDPSFEMWQETRAALANPVAVRLAEIHGKMTNVTESEVEGDLIDMEGK